MGFGPSKILEKDDKWKIILERIATEGIPDEALKAGGFWSKILEEDDKWKIILKRIATEEIPDEALKASGFWSNGHLCAVLPGQYRSTASSTEKKLFPHSEFLTWLLYNAQLDLLPSCAANGGVLLVGRPGLRRLREEENGRGPRGP